MKINLEAVKLERPILLAGKNFGNTIEVSKVSGLELEYDTEEKHVWITYNGKKGLVPMGNVDFMMPAASEPEVVKAEVPAQPLPRSGKVKAQVGGPQHHVFEGPGHGQTGVSTK